MKYDLDYGKKLFEASNFDERIARFMELKKEKGYWQHPGDKNTVSNTLGFNHDWQWLMPVVEKIQLEYYSDMTLKEFDRFDGSFTSSITIYGNSWVHYHWANYDRIKAEIDEHIKKAARYGEQYICQHHQLVESKFQAVYLCVCRFIEWWEQEKL